METGEELAAFILPAGALVAGETQQTLGGESTRNGAIFGDALQLNAYQFSGGNTLELEWQVLHAISGDLRVFAIVLSQPYQAGADFEVILQDDHSPPVPPEFLNTGETFITRHVFTLPAGYNREHGIYVGWYNEALGLRLEAPYPENMLPLEGIDFHG